MFGITNKRLLSIHINKVNTSNTSRLLLLLSNNKLIINNTKQYLTTTTNNNNKPITHNDISFIDKILKDGAKSIIGPFPCRDNRYDSSFKNMNIDDINSEHGTATCSFIVNETVMNGYGTLHGGAIATLVDILGTLALVALDKTKAGVSVDLNVTYLSPAKAGEKVICMGKTLRLGKTLGFTEVEIFVQDKISGNKRLIATGRHTKAFPPVHKPIT
jgi:acyl-coenzyme A thioesterase 13